MIDLVELLRSTVKVSQHRANARVQSRRGNGDREASSLRVPALSCLVSDLQVGSKVKISLQRKV